MTIPDGWKAIRPFRYSEWSHGMLVAATVCIRDNATDEIVECAEDLPFYDGDTHPSHFYWSEGNASCDCNRILYFYRAKGDEARAGTELEDGVCSEDRFSVNIVNPETGAVLYREYE